MLILGHRGTIYDNGVSQNSLRAFQEAVEHADGFETDACVSKDGEVYLLHDAKYSESTGGIEYCAAEHLDESSNARIGTRRLVELTSAEIRAMRLRDGQNIPTLKEAIDLVGSRPGKILNIELHSYKCADPVIALVKKNIANKTIAVDQIILSSFDFSFLQIAREKTPELKAGAIFYGAEQQAGLLYPWRSESDVKYTPLTDEAIKNPILRNVQPNLFVVPEDALTENTVAMVAAQYPQAKLAAWTFTEKGNCNLSELVARLKRLERTGKISAIMPDNPRAFKEAWNA